MTITKEHILDELRRIGLPDGGDIVSRAFVKALHVDGGRVSFVLEVPQQHGQGMEPVRRAAEELVGKLPGVNTVSVVMTAHSDATTNEKAPPNLKIGRHPSGGNTVTQFPNIGRIIAIASGKGGVGKSTIAVNLAVSLARRGDRVGILDADIHGPSLPMMMGVTKKPVSPDGKMIRPLTAHGVTMMSIGLLLPAEEAVIWRGPMLMGALQQMLQQVEWGQLDTLVVDLPPGTGDVQLTLCQKFELSGAIIVCTPQQVALLDARRAIAMFKKLNINILGLVGNMTHSICSKCGHHNPTFGGKGLQQEAAANAIPLLGEIPFAPDIGISGDKGVPIILQDRPTASIIRSIAEQLD
ncbi:MAG: Mrp/NBP35 family ATP-binding protein [Rhodobacteraceae bacterium]|nr:Mrp/NBP35 family ATP-binding protein [Paracoccaceae bacterium]